MNCGIQLRAKVLEQADSILDEVVARSRGEVGPLPAMDNQAIDRYWDVIKDVVISADDPSPMAALTDGSISNRIDAVLADVAAGKLTPAEGKRVMSLLQAGFEMTELAQLVARLEAVEKAK